MKTTEPRTTTPGAIPTIREHPEFTAAPPRSGVIGTILTELEFGEDERTALNDLGRWLNEDLSDVVDAAAERARSVALVAEGLRTWSPSSSTPVRPSIRNLRRHAARQWIQATLQGTFDSAFSRQLRHTWMPILLAEQFQTRATPAVVGAFLDWMEGYVTSRIVDEVAENVVPGWRMLHAFRLAVDVQRRIFGVAS
jgi:hypothetical protein